MEMNTMKKRFSSEELFELRNAIPINTIIADVLRIPSKIADGHFRFLCPKCNEFYTATNPATNLARCFCCNTNFNTIDFVMIVNHSGFVESVKFLKNTLGNHRAYSAHKQPRTSL